MSIDARPTQADPDDDPYLWLEEIDGARAIAWVDARTAETVAKFGSARFAADRDVLAVGVQAGGHVLRLNSRQTVPPLPDDPRGGRPRPAPILDRYLMAATVPTRTTALTTAAPRSAWFRAPSPDRYSLAQ